MANSDAVFGLLGVVLSALIYSLSNIWINRRKKEKQATSTRDMVVKHPVFDRIKQLKLEAVRDMTTGNKLKDSVMKKYANLFLDIYYEQMTQYAQNLKEEDGVDSISKFYYDMLEKLNNEMERSGIAPEYLERIFGESSVERTSLSNEILYIQKDSELAFQQKVYKVFDSIRVHLGIIIGKLEDVTTAMNGHLEEALRKQKG